MPAKGFYVKVVARHLHHMPGDKLYVKACAWRYFTPTLYKIINQKTGVAIDYIDANEMKNRFKRT